MIISGRIIWNLLAESLTPYERYDAMRRLKNSGIDWHAVLTNRAVIMFGWSVIMILLVILAVIRKMRWEKNRQEQLQRFNEQAEQHKLNQQELEILEHIAAGCRLKQLDAIFTLPQVFEQGLAGFIEKKFAGEQDQQERKKINETAFSLKEKLGFVKSATSFGLHSKSEKNLNSRQIPVGQTVILSVQGQPDGQQIETTVTDNNEYQLTAEMPGHVECEPGVVWNVQYSIAGICRQFEAVTLACEGTRLELNHSDTIRFGNRRRFGRAAVSRPAIVAMYEVIQDAAAPQLPQFITAEITEISGPGLCIRAEMDTQPNDRLLVIFEAEPGVIIQDIAEVRGLRRQDEDVSIAAELVGLNERAINELVRITNSAAAQPETVMEGAKK